MYSHAFISRLKTGVFPHGFINLQFRFIDDFKGGRDFSFMDIDCQIEEAVKQFDLFLLYFSYCIYHALLEF